MADAKPVLLIYSPQESTLDRLREMLSFSYALILTKDEAACMAAANQKARPAGAVIDVSGSGKNPVKKLCAAALEILAVCDSRQETRAVEAVRQGAAGYMLLPLIQQELATTLESLIARSKTR